VSRRLAVNQMIEGLSPDGAALLLSASLGRVRRRLAAEGPPSSSMAPLPASPAFFLRSLAVLRTTSSTLE
jgi:hypothetical protein